MRASCSCGAHFSAYRAIIICSLLVLPAAWGDQGFHRSWAREPYTAAMAPDFPALLQSLQSVKATHRYALAVDISSSDQAPKQQLTPSADSKDSTPAQHSLMTCFNSHSSLTSMTWDVASEGKLSTLKAVASLWHRQAPSVPVTVVTFGTLDRLPQLHAQCRAWEGPSSVVLYEPLLQPAGQTELTPDSKARLRFVVRSVVHFLEQLEDNSSACKMDVLVMYEIFSDQLATVLAPLNMLRNYARVVARTPLIAMLDADLLPSKSLYNRILQTGDYLLQQSNNKQVFIMPGFDLEPKYKTVHWAQALASLDTKRVFVSALDLRIVHPFNKKWALGHHMTDFKRWRKASADYTVQYEPWAEPWILGSRLRLPWFDERFRGYGCDKNQHMWGVHVTGHKFKVMFDVFVLHRPHALAMARQIYKGESGMKARGQAWREFLHSLIDQQMVEGKANGTYNPHMNPAVLNCISSLSWWKSDGVQ